MKKTYWLVKKARKKVKKLEKIKLKVISTNIYKNCVYKVFSLFGFSLYRHSSEANKPSAVKRGNKEKTCNHSWAEEQLQL